MRQASRERSAISRDVSTDLSSVRKIESALFISAFAVATSKTLIIATLKNIELIHKLKSKGYYHIENRPRVEVDDVGLKKFDKPRGGDSDALREANPADCTEAPQELFPSEAFNDIWELLCCHLRKRTS